MRKFKTRAVPAVELAIYQKRAKESHVLATYAFSQRLWFGTCINAIHGAIAYADCLAIARRGLRYAGTSHDQAVDFYASLQIDHMQFNKSVQHFGNIISIKNMAEYMGDRIKERDAVAVLKRLERFEKFILSVIPEQF